MTPRSSKRPGLRLAALGAAGLGAAIALLPVVGDQEVPTFPGQMLAYVLVLLPVGVLLYGLLVLSRDLAIRKLLFLGALTAPVGVAAAYLGGRPEALLEGPTVLPLALLYVADAFRVVAASFVGLALARRVTSPGIALLVAVLATTADLYSVFAGPTRDLIEGGAPVLDYLLLWFPTFGYPLGFALGLSDLIFLTLFTAIAYHLTGLRPLLTLALGCVAVLLTMLVAILLGNRPLPVLPFIAVSFILANAVPLARALLHKGSR